MSRLAHSKPQQTAARSAHENHYTQRVAQGWVTGAEAASLAKLDHLPHLDGVLRTDDEALLPGA